MNRFQLVLRSLSHHWRTNLAVLLGVVAGTAVIGGALIVGDSVRASLVKMTLDRLGDIDYVMSGPRFVREDLAAELRQQNISAAPAIVMQAGVEAKSGETTRRAGQVHVYGFDDNAWSMIKTGDVARPQGTGVVVNSQLAAALHVHTGDEVTLWIELPSAVPRDTLLGKKDNDSQEITLKVSAIAPGDNGLSRLGLNPTQSLPLNAFVDLHVLQERLNLEEVKPTRRDPTHKPARVNALLATDTSEPGGISPRMSATQNQETEGLRRPIRTEDRSQLDAVLRQKISLTDLSLRIVEDKTLNCLVVESEQMILEDKLVGAARAAASELKLVTSPVMVYLANKLWNPQIHKSQNEPGFSMYSTVAGLDVLDLDGTPFGGFEFIGEKPAALGDRDVILNEWLATDLKVHVGDEIKFSYHVIGSRGELPEVEQTVTVRGIVKMTGPAIDRNLTPEVKGITDVDSLADWDQPFEMKLDDVTPRDDDYWDLYRATPKMFLPLKAAQKLWPSRYGSLTSLRMSESRVSRVEKREPETKEDDGAASSGTRLTALSTSLLKHLNPSEIGLAFQPVKAIGLKAANGSTDFSGLFFGFSMFLIVAAMILIGLLFRLGIEQRVRDLGLLGAVGFSPRQVRWQMLEEGLIVVVAGSALGLIAAVGYARLMIYGLTHWWVDAVGTKELILSVQPVSLLTGFGIAVVAALISIWWALRQLKGLSLREQLAGVVEKEVDLATQHKRARGSQRRATISAGLALLVTIGIGAGLIPATGAFFGVGILLLVAAMSFLSAWLQGRGVHPARSAVHGHGVAALSRLGLRNASRQRMRSVMTAGMIATATFLIVAINAFRQDPTGALPDKKSGNGGFTLVAETSSPILYDLNTPEGRKKLQLSAPPNSPAAKVLAAMKVVPFRVKPGEDASCLNLYQTRVPTILGVPQSLIDEGRFAFASGSWKVLEGQSAIGSRQLKDGKDSGAATAASPVPVLGDAATLMYSLHKGVGDLISLDPTSSDAEESSSNPGDRSNKPPLAVSGMFQDSVFQGALVMSEQNFLKLFPEQKGFRYFLIEVPPDLADAASSLLETELAEYGFDAEPVAERLARFLSVQNTYLSTFQTLGGLGLLLGTFGLATVMLRNVLERQTELALLRAVGFRAGSVGMLVLLENAFVLSWGLLAGLISALLAVAPSLTSRGGGVPFESLGALLAIVFATGMLAASFAVRTAVRLPIVTTLRGE
jgi:putative ABC transport system permease protein